jgi:hypothetical protein
MNGVRRTSGIRDLTGPEICATIIGRSNKYGEVTHY